MSPGTTTTGHILEQMILPALAQGGYTVQTQVDVGKRPSGRRHRIDILAQDQHGRRFLIAVRSIPRSISDSPRTYVHTILLHHARRRPHPVDQAVVLAILGRVAKWFSAAASGCRSRSWILGSWRAIRTGH